MPGYRYYQPQTAQLGSVRAQMRAQARQLMVCQQRPLLHPSFLSPAQISARFSGFVDAYATLFEPFSNLRILQSISIALQSSSSFFVGGDPQIQSGIDNPERDRPIYATGLELFADGNPIEVPNAFQAFLSNADERLFTMKALAENLGQNALALRAYAAIAAELTNLTCSEVPVGLGLRSTANPMAAVVWVDINRNIYTSTRPINITHDMDNAFVWDDDAATMLDPNSWTNRLNADPIVSEVLNSLPVRCSLLADLTGTNSSYFGRIAGTFTEAQTRGDGLSKEMIEMLKTLYLLDEMARHATYFSLSPLVALHGVLTSIVMSTPELIELIRLNDLVGYTQYEQHCASITAAGAMCSVGHRDYVRSILLGHSVAPTMAGLSMISARYLLYSPLEIWTAARLVAERLATANLAQLYVPLGRAEARWAPSTPSIDLSSLEAWLPPVVLTDYRQFIPEGTLRLSSLRTESGFVVSRMNADLFPSSVLSRGVDVMISSTANGAVGDGISVPTLPRVRDAIIFYNNPDVLPTRRVLTGLVSLENYILHFHLQDTTGRAFTQQSGYWPYLLNPAELAPFKRQLIMAFARSVINDRPSLEAGGYLEQVTWAQTLRRYQYMSYELRAGASAAQILAAIADSLAAMNPMMNVAGFITRLAASSGMVVAVPEAYTSRNTDAQPDEFGTVTVPEFYLPLTLRLLTSLNSVPIDELHLLW